VVKLCIGETDHWHCYHRSLALPTLIIELVKQSYPCTANDIPTWDY